MELELLFCLAIAFILKNQVKKIVKITNYLLMLAISGFVLSLFLKVEFFTGIILSVIINKSLKDFKNRFKDLNRLIIRSRKRYQYGFIEKLVYMLFDMNFLMFVILVGFYSAKELISPVFNMEDMEILFLVFISTASFKLIEQYFKESINDVY